MRTNQRRTSDCSFQTRDDGVKRIEGYFVTFEGEYRMFPDYIETIDPHAFDRAIEGQDIRCLIDHDTRLVLGRTKANTLQLRVDEHGVWGTVLVNENDQDAMNLYARVQRGDVSQCSFGFDILDEEIIYEKDVTRCVIKDVKLYEVSCVTFPAYEDTSIEARRKEISDRRHKEAEARKARLLARIKRAMEKEG